MAQPGFSQFRAGAPLTLEGGGELRYEALKASTLQDHYIRILHTLASEQALNLAEIQSYLKRAASKEPGVAYAVRQEIEARRPHKPELVGVAAASRSAGTASSARRRTAEANKAARVKRFKLVSSGNHKEALRLAQGYSLTPQPIPTAMLRPGQSPEAHTLEADERTASKLITTGYWKSA